MKSWSRCTALLLLGCFLVAAQGGFVEDVTSQSRRRLQAYSGGQICTFTILPADLPLAGPSFPNFQINEVQLYDSANIEITSRRAATPTDYLPARGTASYLLVSDTGFGNAGRCGDGTGDTPCCLEQITNPATTFVCPATPPLTGSVKGGFVGWYWCPSDPTKPGLDHFVLQTPNAGSPGYQMGAWRIDIYKETLTPAQVQAVLAGTNTSPLPQPLSTLRFRPELHRKNEIIPGTPDKPCTFAGFGANLLSKAAYATGPFQAPRYLACNNCPLGFEGSPTGFVDGAPTGCTACPPNTFQWGVQGAFCQPCGPNRVHIAGVPIRCGCASRTTLGADGECYPTGTVPTTVNYCSAVFLPNMANMVAPPTGNQPVLGIGGFFIYRASGDRMSLDATNARPIPSGRYNMNMFYWKPGQTPDVEDLGVAQGCNGLVANGGCCTRMGTVSGSTTTNWRCINPQATTERKYPILVANWRCKGDGSINMNRWFLTGIFGSTNYRVDFFNREMTVADVQAALRANSIASLGTPVGSMVLREGANSLTEFIPGVDTCPPGYGLGTVVPVTTGFFGAVPATGRVCQMCQYGVSSPGGSALPGGPRCELCPSGQIVMQDRQTQCHPLPSGSVNPSGPYPTVYPYYGVCAAIPGGPSTSPNSGPNSAGPRFFDAAEEKCAQACAAGWAVCSGSTSEACDVNTSTDVNNCGTCGNVCPVIDTTILGAVRSCNSGVCGGRCSA